MKGRWLAPALVLLLISVVWPLGRVAWTSLHREQATVPDDRELVGLRNFTDLLESREWWLSVATTLVLVAVVVLSQVVLGVLFGASIDRVARIWPVTRVLALVPLAVLSVVNVVAWDAAVDGGYLATWLGIDGAGPIDRLVVVGLAELWRGTGLVALVVALAMRSVPASLSAAAIADGATGLQRWRRVVLPSIGPAVAAIAAFRVLDTYRVLDGPLLVDDPARVPPASVLTWTTQFTTFELGLGAAMSMIVLLGAVVLALVVTPLLRVRRYV